MEYYFAYGSLMDLDFVRDLGVEYQNAQKGILFGYEFQISVQDNSDTNFGYANVIPKINSKVEGVLFQLDADQLSILDSYEGFPFLYTRKRLNIVSKRDETILAWVYIGSAEFVVEKDLKITNVQKERITNGLKYLSEQYQSLLKKRINC